MSQHQLDYLVDAIKDLSFQLKLIRTELEIANKREYRKSK